MQCCNVEPTLNAGFAGSATVITAPPGPAALEIAGSEHHTLTAESAAEAREITAVAGEVRQTESPSDTRRALGTPPGVPSERKCVPCNNRDRVRSRSQS